MRTFIIGKAKVVGSGGDCIYLTPAQYAAAKVVRNIHLSAEEVVDLMNQLKDEHDGWLPKKGVTDENCGDWMPKKVAPSIAIPPSPVDTDDMTWRQIADMGPGHKIQAIRRLMETDPAYVSLVLAKQKVEDHMASIDGAL